MIEKELTQCVNEAFGGERAPRDYLPPDANLRHPDYDVLRTRVGGRSWEQIAPGFFEEYPELMPLFSDRGFVHYLPRMILDSIASESDSSITDDLAFYLCRNCIKQDWTKRDYYALMSSVQKKAVKEYLEWVLYYLREGKDLQLEDCLDCLKRRGDL